MNNSDWNNVRLKVSRKTHQDWVDFCNKLLLGIPIENTTEFESGDEGCELCGQPLEWTPSGEPDNHKVLCCQNAECPSFMDDVITNIIQRRQKMMNNPDTIQAAIQLTVAAIYKMTKDEIIPFFEEAVKSIEKQSGQTDDVNE